MRAVFAFAAAVSVGGCLPDDAPRLVVVDGEGAAQTAPDQFSVFVSLRSGVTSQKSERGA